MAHARFAPSSAKRIMSCPASLKINEALPDDCTEFAAYGTLAHHIAEMCLRSGQDAKDWVGTSWRLDHNGEVMDETDSTEHRWLFAVDDAMAAKVQEYVDACRACPGDHYPETRVNHSRWCPEDGQFGTCDFAACEPGVLRIRDLKFGEGVKVFAYRNPQLALYALGFFDEHDWLYDFQRIIIEVHQPRLDHIDTWEVSRRELLAFGEEIKVGFTRALEPNPPFGPSEEACQFCKGAATCAALRDRINAEVALAFDDISDEFDPPIGQLPIEELVSAYRVKPLYDIRMTAIQGRLMEMLLAGDEVPGLKLVEGRSNRQWLSEEATKQFLLNDIVLPEDDIYTRKLVSPAQAEKLIPKEKRKPLSTLIFKPSGKPTIAEADDPRPTFGEKNADAFDDLDDTGKS